MADYARISGSGTVWTEITAAPGKTLHVLNCGGYEIWLAATDGAAPDTDGNDGEIIEGKKWSREPISTGLAEKLWFFGVGPVFIRETV